MKPSRIDQLLDRVPVLGKLNRWAEANKAWVALIAMLIIVLGCWRPILRIWEDLFR